MNFNHIVVKNITRDKWVYISYFFSSVFSILIFFLFLLTAFHPMINSIKSNSTLGITMIFCSIIVYIFSFIFIIYSMMAFLDKKSKNIGIFMIIGASMKQMQRMIFRENMIIGIFSIITSVSIGLILAPLFLMITKNILQTDSFGMYFPMHAIFLTIILFILLFLIVSKVITRFIKKEEAITLLKTNLPINRNIIPSPIKLIVSILTSIILLVLFKILPLAVDRLGTTYYVIIFISILSSIYLIFSNVIVFATEKIQKSTWYFKSINMIFASNLKSKGKSHLHIIFLITILLLAVIASTSVLYGSYYNVEEKTESLYPYSFQYISLPGISPEKEEEDIKFIVDTLNSTDGDYKSYSSEFKTDEENRIAFMSNTSYNKLGKHHELKLNNNEYFVISGNVEISPDINTIFDYTDIKLQCIGINENMILTTGLRNMYIIIPDTLYESLDYPIYNVFAYELEDWTEKLDTAKKIESKIFTVSDKCLVTSKISLYDTEKFVKRIMFFIGFMLSLIFLSAAMSILYFYLQTSIDEEKEQYRRIRKIGISIKEINIIVSRELKMLIFVPFMCACGLLFISLFFLYNNIETVYFKVAGISITIFGVLFIFSYLLIRNVYLKKLLE